MRAETRGGVTFDGGGASTFGGLTFVDGAHHQTWDGFRFANGKPTQTGVIVFGGYGRADPAPHHAPQPDDALRRSSARRPENDHLIYFSKDGAHDILIEDYTATPGASIQSALQFYHSPNVYDLTVRRMHVVGTQSAILIYDGTVHDVLIEDSDIRDARDAALNVATTGANVVLRNVTSVNSGGGGPTTPTASPQGSPSSTARSSDDRHASRLISDLGREPRQRGSRSNHIRGSLVPVTATHPPGGVSISVDLP